MGLFDIFKIDKRQSQLQTIKSLNESFPQGWWLAGGWAIEAITGNSSSHRDIDVYVLGDTLIKKKGNLDVHVLHKENDFYVDKRPEGTFYFSKEAFENKSRNLQDIQVRTVSPEFLYKMSLGPKARDKERENSQILKNFVSSERVENVFSFIEKAPKAGIFDRFRTKPPEKEMIETIQELMTKNPKGAKEFFEIFNVRQLKPIERYLDKNSKLGGEWINFRDTAKNVLKSKEMHEKTEEETRRILEQLGVKDPMELRYEQYEKVKNQRALLEKQREEDLKKYPETSQFFEKTEEEAARGRAASEAIEYKQEEREFERELKKEDKEETRRENEQLQNISKEIAEIEKNAEKEKETLGPEVGATAAGAAIAVTEAINYKQEERKYEEEKELEKQVQSLLKPSLLSKDIADIEKNAEQETLIGNEKLEEVEKDKKFIPFGSFLKDMTGRFLRPQDSTSKPTFIMKLFGSEHSEDESKLAPELTPEELLSGDIQDKAALQKLGKERSLQELFDKLTYELADWWGIPPALFSENLPKVKIVNTKEMRDVTHDSRTPGGFFPGLNAVYFASWLVGERQMTPLMYGQSEETKEMDSKALLRSRIEPLSITSLKPMVAEEACHFLEDLVKTRIHIKDDEYVSEFFGMVSRFYIAEQVPEMFTKDLQTFIKKAVEVSDKEAKLRQQLESLNNEVPGNLIEYEKNKMEVQKIEEELAHLAYFPASAYYYDVRKMTKNQRFELLAMDTSLVKNEIIKPLNDNLLKVKNQLLAKGLANKILTPEEISKNSGIEKPALVGGVVAGEIGYKPGENISGDIKELASKSEQVTKPYDESIKDHIKARIYGIPAGQQKVNTYGPIETKISEPSNIEQKAVGSIAAAEAIGKAAYGRIAEAVAAKLEQQGPAIETGDEYPEEPVEEYTQEGQYSQEQSQEEPTEEEYQGAEQEQAQVEYEQPEEVQEEQYGPESEQVPQQPQINIEIPKKVTKEVAKKLESMGIKLPNKMIKN